MTWAKCFGGQGHEGDEKHKHFVSLNLPHALQSSGALPKVTGFPVDRRDVLHMGTGIDVCYAIMAVMLVMVMDPPETGVIKGTGSASILQARAYQLMIATEHHCDALSLSE